MTASTSTGTKAVATIATGAFPHGIRLSPDGRQAYVANLKDGTVSVEEQRAAAPR